VDDDEIVSGHLLADQRKLQNVARDPRVALSIEGTEIQPPGLKQYLVLHGRARLEEGGAQVPADGRPATRPGDAHHTRANRWSRSVGKLAGATIIADRPKP
jgi:hypothetical protein